MDSVITEDGVELATAAWPTARQAIHKPSDNPRDKASGNSADTVLLVHGLGEHVQRYAWLAAQLNASGWNVVGYDLRGHGRSGGRRGGMPAADTMLCDLGAMVDRVRRGQPGQLGQPGQPGQLVLLGHSMGGLIAARFVAEALQAAPAAWSRPVDALVLSSPALDAGMSTLQKLQLGLGSRLLPDLAVNNGLKPAWISRNTSVVQTYVNDPLIHDRITPRLARFIVDGGRFVIGQAPHWATPTLLLWAGADRCVAPSGSAAFMAAAPDSAAQGRCFDGLYHEIFNEPQRDEVFNHLAGWLAGH